MDMTLYHYGPGIEALAPADVASICSKLEKSLRSGDFKYQGKVLNDDQRMAIKACWPETLRKWLNEKVKEKENASAEDVQAILENVLLDEARKRAQVRIDQGNRTEWSLNKEMRLFASDMAMAMLFRHAPLPSPTLYIRDFNNLKVRCQVSDRPVKLVVNCSEIESANVYFLLLYNAALHRCWFLGWAGQKDLKAAPTGNKKTDKQNCSWSEMSYYIPYTGLRPMKDLLKRLSINDIAEGILFESVPDPKTIPYYCRAKAVDRSKPDAGEDYYAIIFGEETQTQPAQKDTQKIDNEAEF